MFCCPKYGNGALENLPAQNTQFEDQRPKTPRPNAQRPRDPRPKDQRPEDPRPEDQRPEGG